MQEVYIGIDWSEKKHDVVFLNCAGVRLAHLVIAHSLAGFAQLEATREQLGLPRQAGVIGLETAHSLLIDFLWSRGYCQIYVIPPNVVKANRGRFGASGSRDDPQEAHLIAEIVRTDRGRLQPWHPDSLLTRQLRAKVSLILHLTRQVNRLANRLRAVLLRYYPAALTVFKTGLESQIALRFLLAYPTPQAAAQLTYTQFADFLRRQAYPRQRVPGCFARLQADVPPTSPETVQVYQTEAVTLARLLLASMQAERRERRVLYGLFVQHPDFATFRSLPGSGEFLAPALCAKFGDDRKRFPSPASVQALAGTCPVTEKSGQSKWVHFRRACDREWRQICQQWAKAMVTRTQSPIAIAYFEQVRPHCRSDSHAYRCLANRWLSVAWKLWQMRSTYDQAYHFQQRAARCRPQT